MTDIEYEANAFAIELLMPREFLLKDLKAMGGIDVSDDVGVARLAKKYRVSQALMALRIGQLLELKSFTPVSSNNQREEK